MYVSILTLEVLVTTIDALLIHCHIVKDRQKVKGRN